jgi:hypothetical protein
MVRNVALLVALILAGAALVHVYWALGGKTAGVAAVPERDGRPAFVPARLATLAVAACLLVAAYVVAAAGRLLSGPPGRWTRLAAFALALVFFARAVGDFRLVGLFKKVRTSRFARQDTWVYSPLCLGLALAIAYLACHVV